jgi:hypothetical protein
VQAAMTSASGYAEITFLKSFKVSINVSILSGRMI